MAWDQTDNSAYLAGGGGLGLGQGPGDAYLSAVLTFYNEK